MSRKGTPITATGTPCKLCKAKGPGIRCHIHNPRSPSPRSPRSRTSPSNKTYSDIDDLLGNYGAPTPTKSPTPPVLPKDALMSVMLHMNRRELNILCNKSRMAKNICDSALFRKMYEEAHPVIPNPYVARGKKIHNPKLVLLVGKTHTGKERRMWRIRGTSEDGEEVTTIISGEEAKKYGGERNAERENIEWKI